MTFSAQYSISWDRMWWKPSIADHPGHHLDFKTLTIVSDAPAEAAKPAPAATPASPAPADPPKK